MGLNVYIFKSDLGDASNWGVTSRTIKGLCITNVQGPSEPSEAYPAAKLVKRSVGNVVIRPDEIPEGKWTMFGGCFAYTSDSRFSEAVQKLSGYPFGFPVAIHDRVEY